MNSNYFLNWLHELYKPCCIVYSTDKAKESIKKNNLSPAEFLTPLGDFSKIKLEYEINKIKYTINNFKLEFYDSEKFIKKTPEEKLEIINNCMKYNLKKPKFKVYDEIISKQYVDLLIKNLKYYSFGWYKEFELTFFECLKFNELEYYQNPLFNIIICSINDNLSEIPKIIQKKIPKIVNKFYHINNINVLIILNDINDENHKEGDEYEKIKQKILNNYNKKYYFFFWNINQFKKKVNYKSSISWIKYIHKTDLYDTNYIKDFKEKKYGEFLSEEEMNIFIYEFRKTFLENILNDIIKHVEILSNNIEKNKSKFKKNIFSFKSEGKNYLVEYDNMYELNKLEKHLYVLIIYYFYFHQYNLVHDYCKLLFYNLKDKSKNHFLLLNEIYIISNYITNYNNKKIELSIYNSINKENLYYFIRWSLIKIKMYENNNVFDKNDLIAIVSNLQNYEHFISNEENNDKNIFSIDKIIIPLIFEKTAIYCLIRNQYKHFLFNNVLAGFYYQLIKNNEFLVYSLNCFNYLTTFCDNNSDNFPILKCLINKKMSQSCFNLKNYEGSFIFSKNYLEICGNSNIVNEKIEEQIKFLNYYIWSIQNLNKKNINEIHKNINLNSLNIPKINNFSLTIIENQDYKIIQKYKNLKWEKFIILKDKNNENFLDENDIKYLKNLDNLEKLSYSNFYKKRTFFGYKNYKLFFRFEIENPLNFDIQIDSIKIDYEFIKVDNTKDILTEVENQEINLNLNRKSKHLCEIYLNPKKEGVILIKGVEFLLFKESKIFHSFYENNNLNLYKNRLNDKKIINENYDNNHNNNKNINSIFDKYLVKKKEEDIKNLKITYNILKKEEDIYYELPMTDNINVYQYQFLLYPIKIINNSKNFNVKKCTIFLDTIITSKNNNNFNNTPLTLFKYINFDINNKIEEFFIPIFPQEKIKGVIKVLLKFQDEKKYKYIEIKRFVIDVNVIDSFDLDINEEITNYEKKKSSNKLDKIFFSLNVKTKNLKNLKKFEIFNFYYNNTINLINSVINNDNNNINNKYDYLKKNFENVSKNFFDFSFLFSKDKNYNYIIKKLSNIINNNDDIFIPWSAKTTENNNKNIEKKIKGFYIFQTNLQKPQLDINLIKIIFIKSIEIKHEIIKISNDKILINLNIILDKSGLYHIKLLKKYNIFFDYEKNFLIDKKNLFTICTQNYIIKNKKNPNNNNDIEILYFNFITENKKLFEVNNLYSQLYIKDVKKLNNNNNKYNLIKKIKIIKPFYINIDI